MGEAAGVRSPLGLRALASSESAAGQVAGSDDGCVAPAPVAMADTPPVQLAGQASGTALAAASVESSCFADDLSSRNRFLRALMGKAKERHACRTAGGRPVLPRGSGVVTRGSGVVIQSDAFLDLFPECGSLLGAFHRVPLRVHPGPARGGGGCRRILEEVGSFAKVKGIVKSGEVRWLHAFFPPDGFMRSRQGRIVCSLRRPGGIKPKAKDTQRVNLLVKRVVYLARLSVRMGGLFSIASPVRSLLWQLDSVRALKRLPGVRVWVGDACCFGGYYRRTLRWVTNAPFLELVAVRCPGGQGHLHQVKEGPQQEELAEGLCGAVAAAYASYHQSQPCAAAAMRRRVNVDQYTDEMEPTRKQRREQENRDCVGGMRGPVISVARLPGWRAVGARVRAIIDQYLDSSGAPLAQAVRAMGGAGAQGPSAEWIRGLRTAIAEGLGLAFSEEEGLQGWLAQAVGRLAGDPDTSVTEWFRGCVPLGVLKKILPGGVFPPIPDNEHVQDLEKARVLEIKGDFSNYQSMNDFQKDALAELEREACAGYLELCECRAKLERAYGPLVPSRIAVLTKAVGLVKRVRLIHDLRRSGVNARLILPGRVVLPRVGEVTRSVIELFGHTQRGDEVSFMSLDFKDAFKQLVVSDEEKRFLSGKVGRRWFVYHRLLFGVASGPLLWGRVGAFVGRSTQALYAPAEARLHIFVDDPIQIARGAPAQTLRIHMISIAWWLALGLQIAWHKGSRGAQVDWIGARLSLSTHQRALRVSLPDAKRTELLASCQSALAVAGVSAAALRRLAGKCSWVAGLVPQLRPFVRQIWGACAASKGSVVVPLRRYRHAVAWVAAFCEGSPPLVREFFAGDDSAPGFTMEVDASPWGGGAIIWSTPVWAAGGPPVRYMVVRWAAEDERLLLAEIGTSRSQATWEAFMMLLAIRQWAGLAQRGRLCVRGDASGVLSGLVQMRASSSIINEICKELALAIAPWGMQLTGIHVYSEQNKLADALSRMAVGAGLPPGLGGVPVDLPAPRGHSAWRILGCADSRAPVK